MYATYMFEERICVSDGLQARERKNSGNEGHTALLMFCVNASNPLPILAFGGATINNRVVSRTTLRAQ
jgi:hypothetical protein